MKGKVMLTLQSVDQVVGSIKDLDEAAAVAALGGLLSIPQHVACTHSQTSTILWTWYECCRQEDKDSGHDRIHSP